MKRLFTTFAVVTALLSSVSFSAKAEKMDNLIKDGTAFFSEEFDLSKYDRPGVYARFVVWIAGDVQINGKTYCKVWQNRREYTDRNKGYVVPSYGDLLTLARCEDGKIYAFSLGHPDAPEEVLIYDGSLSVDESCNVYSNYSYNYLYEWQALESHGPLKCFATGTVTSCGNDYDLVYVDRCEHWHEDGYMWADELDKIISGGTYDYWIKGAAGRLIMCGSENDHFGWAGREYYSIECIYSDDVKVFDRNDMSEIRNIKTTAVNEVEAEAEESTAPKYHPDGTPFADGEKGIYIQSGKKRIAL